MNPTIKPADQLRLALLIAICGACLYSFVYSMFLATPSQGLMLSPNINRYCQPYLTSWRLCEKRQRQDCSTLKETAEACADEVRTAYEVVNIKCGSYIDAWTRCRKINEEAKPNEKPCADQNGAMLACVDAIVKPQLASAGFGNKT